MLKGLGMQERLDSPLSCRLANLCYRSSSRSFEAVRLLYMSSEHKASSLSLPLQPVLKILLSLDHSISAELGVSVLSLPVVEFLFYFFFCDFLCCFCHLV